MNEEYYAFFEDGTSITKMTLEEAIAIPYKEYIIKIERSPRYTPKNPSFAHTIMNDKGEGIRLKFGDWELIDLDFDFRSWDFYYKEVTYYNHSTKQTYKRKYNGRFELYFFNEILGFMKRISSEGGWQLYEYEQEIEKLNKLVEEQKRNISKLYDEIESLQNPESPVE